MLTIMICLLLSVVDHPDGTLVLSSKPGTLVGNIAKRLTGGDQYTHIGIVIDGKVYESDWPKTKSTCVESYGKPRTTNDYYEPIVPYTPEQINKMKQSVQNRMNQPYQLRNYLRPNSPKTRGTWCSPFVLKTLNDGGRYKLHEQQGFEPQTLLESVTHDYALKTRVQR